MTVSYTRGHKMYFKNKQWFFCDDDTPTVGNTRPCGFCGRDRTAEGHDGCIGEISGIMNACCGHGVRKNAYVQFAGKNIITGNEALEYLMKHRNTPEK